MDLALDGDPVRSRRASGATSAIDGHDNRLEGDEPTVLAGLFGLIEAIEPDIILFPGADTWTERLVKKAGGYGIETTFSLTGRYAALDARSYFLNGRMYHKAEGAVLAHVLPPISAWRRRGRGSANMDPRDL